MAKAAGGQLDRVACLFQPSDNGREEGSVGRVVQVDSDAHLFTASIIIQPGSQSSRLPAAGPAPGTSRPDPSAYRVCDVSTNGGADSKKIHRPQPCESWSSERF